MFKTQTSFMYLYLCELLKRRPTPGIEVHFMQGSTLKEKPRVTVTSTSDLSEYEKLVNHRRAYNNKIR